MFELKTYKHFLIIISLLISSILITGCTNVQKGDISADNKDEIKTASTNFSFTVPDGYLIADSEIWEKQRYQDHLDNPNGGMGYRVPDFVIIDEPLNGKTLDEFARSKHGTVGFDYEKLGSDSNNYKKIKINDIDFIRVMSADMTTQLGYYAENNKRVAGIVDPWVKVMEDGKPDPKADEFLLKIIKTIKFN